MAYTSATLSAEYSRKRSYYDLWILILWMILLGFGWVMVYSATISASGGEQLGELNYVGKHGLFVLMGMGLAFIVSHTRLDWWHKYSNLLLLLAIVSLALVLLPGVGAVINGSKRWIPMGPVNFQPSEMAKLFFVVYLASVLSRNNGVIDTKNRETTIFGIVFVVFAVLLLAEPDFGGFVVLTGTTVAMVFLAGIRLRYFTLFILVAGLIIALLAVTTPYRLERLTGFLDPWSDPYGSGFQLIQALIAFGRGEFFGVGLGASIQKLFYLPHAHNDFLLAVIGEELGLLGVLVVITVFSLLFWRCFYLSKQAEMSGYYFASRLAQGLGLLILIQAMVNIGVNLGVLPTKGLTLPLMSYGGSAMLTSCIAVGLLLLIEREIRPQPRRGR